jgi:pyruvate/2-oxoglutarate dehydrogenase complex dihydrolipoamide acyltransferase (E2) component
MSILGSIMSKIFHGGHAAAAPAPQPAQAPAQAAPAPAQAAPAAAASAPAQQPQVDVAAVLETMAKDNGQNLDWQHSIVDLMKLLSLDSSLTARKQLAQELGYTGDTEDSATMNIWLHKQVMQKLAENGGIVPDSLR